jgi:hypothetical protein
MMRAKIFGDVPVRERDQLTIVVASASRPKLGSLGFPHLQRGVPRAFARRYTRLLARVALIFALQYGLHPAPLGLLKPSAA